MVVMVVLVYSLNRVMQDIYHQPYCGGGSLLIRIVLYIPNPYSHHKGPITSAVFLIKKDSIIYPKSLF